MKQYKKDIKAVEAFIEKDLTLQEYLKIRKNERPNYWYILYHQDSDRQMVPYEKSYSKVLRWLLDPNENHQLGHRFAEEILSFHRKRQVSIDKESKANVKTEWNHVDVIYKNSQMKEVIAIEVKQYSEEGDHSQDDDDYRSQLDTYEKVIKNKFEKDDALTMIYLTPLGISSKSETASQTWIPMSYKDLIDILDQLTLDLEQKKNDIIRIIEDFQHDLRRTMFLLQYSQEKGNIKERLKSSSLISEAMIERLWKLIGQEKIEKNQEVQDLLTFEIKESVSFIKEALVIQNHTPNEKVQYMMRRLFNVYAENKMEIKDLSQFGKETSEDRVSSLNSKAKEIFPGFEYIRLSEGKGQGIFICDQDPRKSNLEERIEIYFSGDARGTIPNAGLQKIYFKEDKKIIERIPMQKHSVKYYVQEQEQSQKLTIHDKHFTGLQKDIQKETKKLLFNES